MIEPLRGRLKKLFVKELSKNEKVFFVLNGNPGQALVVTEKRIAILKSIKSSFLRFSDEAESFFLSRFISEDISIGSLWCLLSEKENILQIRNIDGNIINSISFPQNKKEFFLQIVGYIDKMREEEIKRKKELAERLKKLKEEEKEARRKKEKEERRKKKEEARRKKEEEARRKKEEEEKEKRNQKNIFLKKLDVCESKLAIEKRIDDLFEKLPSGFALCFLGSIGLGKTYQALRVGGKDLIVVNPGDLWTYLYHEDFVVMFFDDAQKIPKSEQEDILVIIDKGFKIILATTDAEKLPPTLRKKLIFVNFQPYSLDEMKEILKRICSKNDEFDFLIEMSEEEIFNILKLSKGNAGELIRILKLVKGLGIEKTLEVLGISISDGQINLDTVKSMSPFEFQKWVVKVLGGKESDSKVGDMGIDGIIEKSNFWHQEGIIQVKQFENIGRNVVDNFETAMRRAKYKRGYIVAYSFTNGALNEARRAKNEEDLDIKLITVEEILRKTEEI